MKMTPSHDFARRVQECTDRLAVAGVDALGALADLVSQRLVRFAAALTRHQQDAEDAVQSALVKLALQPQLLSSVDSPWPYLLQMVRNQALMSARQKRRCSSGGDLSDLVTYCPLDEVEREESYRAVWSALRTLPPEQVEVVVLKTWEDMTFAQIGEILGSSPNTVASRYQYAMAKLARRLLKQHQDREVRCD